jgi:YVTN family beta-propeller protein
MRPTLAAVTLLAAMSFADAACARRDPATIAYVYVTNERSGDVSVLDADSGDVLATVPLGKRPRGIVLAPNRQSLFIALSGSPIQGPPGSRNEDEPLPPADRSADGIGELDVNTHTLRRVIKAGTDPEQVAISPDGSRLYVANEDAGQLTIVGLPDGNIVAHVPVGEEPEGVAVSPDGSAVYVTSEDAGEIFVVDAASQAVITHFEVGHRPRGIAFSPDGARAYVTLENDGAVAEIDARAHRLLKAIVLEGTGNTPRPRPMGIVASADGATVYVTTGSFGSLFMFNPSADATRQSFAVGQRPWGIGVRRDGRTAFTANGPSNDVSFVDLVEKKVVKRVPVGASPWGIAVMEPEHAP